MCEAAAARQGRMMRVPFQLQAAGPTAICARCASEELLQLLDMRARSPGKHCGVQVRAGRFASGAYVCTSVLQYSEM